MDIFSYMVGKNQGGGSVDTEEVTVDLNFPEYTPETDILSEVRFAASYISDYGAYGHGFNFSDTRPFFPLALGDECIVYWDGDEYEVTVGDSSTIVPDTLYVGNGSGLGLSGNGEPFAVAWDATGETGVTILSTVDTEWTEHTIRIYKRASGSPDQVVEPSEEGKVMSKVTVTKPETLVPENVRSGIDVGGVVGSFLGDTEEKTVALNFANGTQTVEPSAAGKVLAKVNIPKPDTLLPENIAEGIDIAGIIGTLAASGGGGVKIATGKFTGDYSNTKTITHGLGVLPDVIFVSSGREPYSYSTAFVVLNAIGFSAAFKNSIGANCYGAYGLCGYSTYTGARSVGIERDTEYQVINRADANKFIIGGKNSNKEVITDSSEYDWIAIAGLT
jgi:hypothetical protein